MTIEPKYDEQTAAKMKTALESKLNNIETRYLVTDEEKNAYLDVEKEIFRIRYPIDNDCRNIPPWERTPNQILRDVNDTGYYTLDEIGFNRRFVAEYADWLRWNDSDKKWYVWTGKYWTAEAAEHKAIRATEHLIESLYYERPANFAISIPEGMIKKILLTLNKKYSSFCMDSARTHARKECVNLARSYLVQKFNTSKLIPFDNCMYDPETGTTAPHRPEDFNTSICPTALNLDAADFPEGEKFFREISNGREDWTKALFRALGECLKYGNPGQWFLVFYGTGRNGKGVLVDWISSALGTLVAECEAVEINKNNFPKRQTTICDALKLGSRILLFKEAGGITYDDNLLKKITGERRASLTRITTGASEYDISATIIMITNNLPTSETGGISMIRRQIGFPFSYTVPDEDIDVGLLQKLTTKEGNEWLVCQMVKALREAHETDAAPLKQSLPRCVSAFTEVMISEGDPVYRFLNECCTVTRNPKDRTSRHDLWDSFQNYYYDDDGVNPTPIKNRMPVSEFAKRLQNHNIPMMEGIQRTQTRKERYVFSGILLNEKGNEHLNNSRIGYQQ